MASLKCEDKGFGLDPENTETLLKGSRLGCDIDLSFRKNTLAA